jgi:hypothetical protein
MRKLTIVMALSMLTAAMPAQAQGLLGTLKSIKSQVETMTRPKAPTAQTPTTTQAATAGDPATQEGDAMFSMATLDDASDSALSTSSLRRNDVMSYDLLGFKLGMTPREVGRVGDKKRIRRVMGPSVTGDFDLEATRIANRSLSRRVSDRSKRQLAIAYGQLPDGGRVQLDFALEQTGPKLSLMTYNTKPQGQSREQIRAALIAKYGQPDWDMGYQMFWCNGIPKCSGGYDQPRFQVFMDDTQVMFTLNRGSAYTKRVDAALNARAAEIAGRNGKPLAF